MSSSPIARLALAVPAAALLALAGCGSSNNDSSSKVKASPPPSASKSSSGGAAGALQLSADPSGQLKFDKTALKTKAGKVTITMKNPSGSGVPHAIAVEGNGVDKDGKHAQPGSGSTVSVSLKAGKYEFYCPVDGHKQAGMKGTLTVN
jgi:uncharacterized cupredoxin-like copper-binding protein